ncbi:PAS domain-containing protein [Porphyrobacter algicida]|uniref:histidine kinase n=1 Tax=Qipengyuania algicida TaxID=1836209 RepID=A0A845AK07_9SPHN|nr:PAS domain-containing sensor histidine kinase [Qipengyuania algicida]MXP29231.1 PAS domain-containing protein [Qipengyuania algicida]
MTALSSTLTIVIGLLLAGWTIAAGWMMIRASSRAAGSEATRKSARRLGRMIEESPAIPLLVRTDGRIEAPDRLARWLGLDRVPDFLSELSGDSDTGLSAEQLSTLTAHIRRTQKTAAPFKMTVTALGSNRSLALRGGLADPSVSPIGAALVWVFDFTEAEQELGRLRHEAVRAREDFGALVGLIEAAPMPMWFRGPDYKLRLVNSAYVEAVGAATPDAVVEAQIELVEAIGGMTAAEFARQAAQRRAAIERVVTATINGARRSLRVTDLPLAGEGIAGYAVDIEEMEEQAREFRAFREAQRSMLDQLSIGVAQFDGKRQLTFANQPFHRVFSLPPGVVNERTSFERILMVARENGRIPEVRDFPAWRSEKAEWFTADEPLEEAWPLPDSKHLRIVAQPLPDGGLVMIAEDRTEQLAISAMRDTLLRTRTATFDNLFEALAVVAPDGNLELWNRSFPTIWGLEPEEIDAHPQAESLLKAIAEKLSDRAQIEPIGQVIRSAALDRRKREGTAELADGRTLDYAGVPLPDGNGLLIVLDVTASRQAEEALRERNRALEEADAVMTRFLANMSYEFRTPLTSIGGFAELLMSGVAGDLQPQARDYVEAIAQSVTKLTEQVENVLDLSQSEAGLMPLTKQTVDLMPFVTDIVRKREERILEAGITLDLRGDAGSKAEADPQQLRRAIAQLLDNAIVFTPAGGRIRVEIRARREATRITISDNGQGMTHSELARALEGIRPSIDGTRVERRQGLGIPLARQLIEAHGGALEITSRKGQGTSAVIILP